MTYRPEIDGLRAIAVISVILYHAELSFFGGKFLPGGFIGVDIFFVISGYLISRILIREIVETGRINFSKFYERRARRILPVLLVVMLASLPFAWRVLLPTELVEFSKSILSAIFFTSNFFFYFATTVYGADSALLKPFLHTWSLGIEEQFYILFPIFLIVSYRFMPRQIGLFMVILSLGSLWYSNVIVQDNKQLAFFLPFARMWELLIGSILAYYELKKGRLTHSNLSQCIPLLGLGLILGSMVFFDGDTLHPGVITILPVLGVAAVIRFASGKDATSKILSLKPMIAMGLVSYSAYLWHFPIFAFARTSNGAPSLFDKGLWIGFTLILAFCSFYLIERPTRNSIVISKRLFLVGMLSFLFVVIVSNLAVLSTGGFKQRLPAFMLDALDTDGFRDLSQNQRRCHAHPALKCAFEIDTTQSVSVVLTGDSHADTLSSDLFKKLENAPIHSFVQMTAGGCPIIKGFSRDGNRFCTPERQQKRLDALQNLNQNGPNIVIYFMRTPVYLTGQRFDGGAGHKEGGPDFRHSIDGSRADNLLKTLNVVAQNNKLILVYPMPEMGIDVPSYYLQNLRKSGMSSANSVLSDQPLTIEQSTYTQRMAGSFAVFDAIDIPDFQRIYPHTLFCGLTQENLCQTTLNGKILYSDSNHPNQTSANLINQQIVVAIDHALKALAK